MVRASQLAGYRRDAAVLIDGEVLHPEERAAAIQAVPALKRRKARPEMTARWAGQDRQYAAGALKLVNELDAAVAELADALDGLGELKRAELLGKVEGERLRLDGATSALAGAREALARYDFGPAGAAAGDVIHTIESFGGQLVVALNGALAQAAVGRDLRDELEANVEARRTLVRGGDTAAARVATAAESAALQAETLRIATRILSAQVVQTRRRPRKDDKGVRVRQPHELETFADVGGLEDVKERLRTTIGAILEDPDKAAKYRVVHNGILFHGPPGTGKTLLSRALAGEYGLRYIRFSPASIASSYIHEAAANLRRLFEVARNNVPIVLFLDEIDTIAGDRGDQPNADHREVVTQLMNSLEEYRDVPGLVIMAATNDIDRLDPGLREGRFDTKILLGLPDLDARKDIVRVLLDRRSEAVGTVDVDEVARKMRGHNAAAIETVVSAAAQLALANESLITTAELLQAIGDREGNDRTRLDDRLGWDDVVLADDVQEQLDELLTVFAEPDLARRLGVTAPAGILLHGPPGTGKTTIAKVVATQVAASFYEISAADLLSKWAGESEQKVAKLFTKARANRPAVIFIDEVEGLLRRRVAESSAPWEQRVVGQFLRELDGLRGGDGVLLIGATNRLDIIDDAIVARRLTPIEVGMPDLDARERLLRLLCRDVALAADVDLRQVAAAADGMSGADLKRIRDTAGRKALTRSAKSKSKASATVAMADFEAAVGTPAPARGKGRTTAPRRMLTP